MTNKANIQINIIGDVFTNIEKLQANFANVVNVIEKVDNTVNKTFNSIQNKLNVVNFDAIVERTRNYSELISSISMPGINVETATADLSAITGIVGVELDSLVERSREVGISSGLGAKGSLEAYKLLASQIQVDKIGIEGLNNLHKETITLAQASGMSMADAANSMAGTINQFGLEASEANRVINVLAAGSKYGAAKIPELAQSFKVVGAAANAAGLNVEQTAGAIEVLSKNNLKGAEAGTALRNIILKMQTALGVDFSKMSLTDALDQLKPKLNDATYLSKLFGMENVAAAQFLITNASAVQEMTDQVTGTNVAQEQAAITAQTTAFSMQQYRAMIDDVKISVFEFLGPSAGIITVLGEQMVMVAQLMPLISGLGSTIMWFAKIQNLQKIATVACNIVTGIWTGIQWALNAALWACPITWIIAAILALVGIIIYLCTAIEGWGAQWDSIVNFCRNCFELFTEKIKFGWNTMINGLMIGLDYIKLGWYKFKEACGLGDSSENQAAIAQINADMESRKQAIVDGAKKIAELTVKTTNSLTWELGMKEDTSPQSITEGLMPQIPQVPGAVDQVAQGQQTTTPKTPIALDLNGAGGNKGSAGSSSGKIDLDKIIPQDIKGSTTYGSIAAKIGQFKIPSLATAAATLAMPLAMTTTAPDLPTAPNIESINQTTDTGDYSRRTSSHNITVKACDKIEIHIASADGKGCSEIEQRISKIASKAAFDAVNKIFDNEA